MKIHLVCIDTRGGVQPYLALARGIQAAGHTVVLLAAEGYRGLIAPWGLEHRPLSGDTERMLQSPEIRAAMEKGFLATHRLMIEHATRLNRQWLTEASEQSRDAEMLIAGFGGLFVSQAIAEKRGLPVMQAHLQPLSATCEYPGVLAWHALAGWGAHNRLSHWLTRQVFWQPLRAGINAARAEVLGLPPAPFWGTAGIWRTGDPPLLHGYSPTLLPRPREWRGDIHVTGYWFLDPSPDWRPPEGLSAFLDAGPPPVAIGFGSMSSQDAEATARLVLEAVESVRHRVVLLSGWGGLNARDLPPWAYLVESVPHAWLYPRCAAVVHHGGAGTTGAGLRAGVPSVIVPFAADQPFWAWIVGKRGCGVSPGSRGRLTASKLAESLRRATSDRTMIDRAAEVGRAIRAEDGVGNAVTHLERFLHGRTPVQAR